MRVLLHIVSLFYLALIRIRLFGYRFKFLKQHVFDTPVISIGNITVGGTGKTPMVICFSQLLTKQNIKHAIVSRGYKKTARGTIVVQDYNKKHVNDPIFAGDEPVMLTYKLTNIPIVVDSNKARGIATTIEKFNPEIILLDDGFQSLYIDKKRDCVLIDCSLPLQEYQLIPRGRLREPLLALKRADFVMFVNKGNINNSIKEIILPILNQYTIPFFETSFKSKLYQHNYNTQSLEKYDSKEMGALLPCVAISGIGNAGPFIDEANKFCNVCDTWSFPDHYNYQKNEKHFDVIIGNLERMDEKKSDGGIITTLKDYVKIIQLPCVQSNKCSLYVLDIGVVIEDDNKVLESILREG